MHSDCSTDCKKPCITKRTVTWNMSWRADTWIAGGNDYMKDHGGFEGNAQNLAEYID